MKMGTEPECIFVKFFRKLFAKKPRKLTAEERKSSRELVRNVIFKDYDNEWVDVRLGGQVQTRCRFENSSIEIDCNQRRTHRTDHIFRRWAKTIKHVKDFDEEIVGLKRIWMRAIRRADNNTRQKIKRMFEAARESFATELDLMFEMIDPDSPLLKDDSIRAKTLEYTWDLHWQIEDFIEEGKLNRTCNFLKSIMLLMVF